ncbi:MAG: ATP-binding protein [Pseudomonadota bacterium]
MSTQQANILVVDDEPGPRESLRMILQDEYGVSCEADGDRALAHVRTQPVDLVTLDLRLPGMDGIDLLCEIKALDRNIEVVVVTGYGSLHSAIESIHHGVFDYVTKPFNIAEIKATVAKSLERRRLNLEMERFFREMEEQAPPDSAPCNAQTMLARADTLREMASLRGQMVRTERLSTVGIMTAGFIHEINNPLASVAAFAELALAKLRDPDPQLTEVELSLQKILGESKRIAKLAGRMLGLAREQSSQATEPADCADLIENVLQLVRGQMSRKGLVAVWQRPEARLVIGHDGDQIKQVLLNLLINAIHATPEGGSVVVRLAPEDDVVKIRVSDTGSGIAPEHLSRIFEPFFTTKAEGEGTGLGLYICRQIVGRCHGSLDVDTTPGQGTTFTISLPAG